VAGNARERVADFMVCPSSFEVVLNANRSHYRATAFCPEHRELVNFCSTVGTGSRQKIGKQLTRSLCGRSVVDRIANNSYLHHVEKMIAVAHDYRSEERA
jgi:hypothetical protein